MKFTKYTTPEDAAILNRLQPSPNFDRGAADARDYLVMLSKVRGETQMAPSTVDVSHITEYGLTQKLSNAVRCF